MADTVAEVASEAGISPDQANQGLGALLSSLKEKLPAGVFAQVEAAVPNAANRMGSAEAGQEPSSGGGVFGAVAGLAKKMFGGGSGGAPALLAKLQELGLSGEQIQKFLPAVLDFLKSKLPPEAMKQVSSLIPTPEGGGE
jgi:hypothetical protein